MANVLNINEAYRYLKAGYTLYSIKDENKQYYKADKGKVYINSDNISFLLNFEQFLTIFKETKFHLKDNLDDEIDDKKDEEYYQKLQSKQ